MSKLLDVGKGQAKNDAEYISDLESTICELANHSHLTVAFIEDMVSGSGEDRKRLIGGEDFYYIPRPDVGALLYGVYALDAKLRDLRDAYCGRLKV